MERNFFRRVEVAFPILDRELRDGIIEDLNLYLRDDRQAWLLGPDGRFERALPPGVGKISAQQELIRDATWLRPGLPFDVKILSRRPCVLRYSTSCCKSAEVSGWSRSERSLKCSSSVAAAG